MTPNEMIVSVRRRSNLPAMQGRASDPEIMEYLNEAKKLLCLKIIESDQNFFEVDDTINFVSGQEEYDIPRHFKDGKITLVERLETDGTVLWTVEYVRFQEKEQFSIDGQAAGSRAGQYYYLRGRKIGLKPKPSSSISSAVKVYGTQFPHDMFWGTLDVAGANLTTTTFKMAAAGPLLKAGSLSSETDYYKNAIIRIVSVGSTRGLERKITAYNPATQMATIETAWTVADVASKDFVVLCSIPEEYHEALVAYGVIRISSKSSDKGARFEIEAETWKNVYENLATTIEPRRFDRNEHVRGPVDEEMYDP